ncbi:S9 family peptidase [Ruegeria sp. B32]|uniref:alpha/beta hydrolase family protein n=1 Tax=Ruegeria sp. B32 TaxID=2867020 RepID=UPI0021A36A0E|nr:CocE/NonD family hydrolase [Ruegeria sp. B32]UWR08460.1 dienelactone hydrolase family protein [Ruegeria sp. B32]
MRFSLTIATLVVLATQSFAQDSVLIGDAPLPADIAIDITPDSPFLGIWTGRWDSWRSHILVVENRDEDGLFNVVYSVGRGQHGRGNWFRSKARLDGNTLVFTDNDFAARYSISGTGRLRGTYPTEDRVAILERQTLSEVLATATRQWFEVGTRDFLTTELREDGATVELAVAIYRPPGDGPFPLALVHHGSTGSGTDPQAFDRFFSNDWLADVLNSHGWIAAFPQRRGRGGSDGLYDEGFAEDRTEGYSTEARLSLAGAERALMDAKAALHALQERPDVSDGSVLLIGFSRGGIVALMQAGDDPGNTAGVINFVGGWMAEGYGDPQINPTLFRRIGTFDGPVLSIYGEDDMFYSIEHSLSNLTAMEAMGANSETHIVAVPGYNKGHWVLWWPILWEEIVSDYIRRLQDQR